METIKYELKYCERCGTLKLRRVASASMYCRHCDGLLARYARVNGKAEVSGAMKRFSSGLDVLAATPVVMIGVLMARAQ